MLMKTCNSHGVDNILQAKSHQFPGSTHISHTCEEFDTRKGLAMDSQQGPLIFFLIRSSSSALIAIQNT
jgi:hypothetical protein